MNGVISDTRDCDQMRNFEQKYPQSIVLPLIANTDGAKFFKLSDKSIWLIRLYQCFLNPTNRFKTENILVVAAHFDSKMPCMKKNFYPLLKDLKNIQENGGIGVQGKIGKYNFMPIIVGCCCGLSAKAEVQSMNLFSGYLSCGYCFHPGVSITSKENNRKFIRYVSGNTHEPRSHQDFIETYRKLKSRPITLIRGTKGISCMAAAENFDFVNGFCIACCSA